MVDNDDDDGMDPIDGDNGDDDGGPLLAFGAKFPPLTNANSSVSLSSLAPLVEPFAAQCIQARAVYANGDFVWFDNCHESSMCGMCLDFPLSLISIYALKQIVSTWRTLVRAAPSFMSTATDL